MDDMKERLVMLRYDGYADVADLVENLDYKVNYCISQEAEMKYLKAFVQQSDFGEEIYKEQFRALWTAYCFHHDLDVDTDGYDEDLVELWRTVEANHNSEEGLSWGGFGEFDSYMCAYLV